VTVTLTVVVLPSLDAVTTVVPGAMPLTTPVAATVAMAGALEDHVTNRPASGAPVESCGVATSVPDWPGPIASVPGDTLTAATGVIAAATVTFTVAERPSLVAVTAATPGAVAVISPAFVTVATAGLDELHTT
jgi:hypothetical protein